MVHAARCGTLRCVTDGYGTLWCITARCGMLRHIAVHHGSLGYVAAPYGMLQYVTARCDTLMCVTHSYATLRCVTVVRYVVYGALRCCVTPVRYGTLLGHVRAHYGALRIVTARCSALWYAALRSDTPRYDTLQHVMVLRSVAACCSTLRCITDR